MSELLAGAARASIAPRADDLTAGIYLGGFGSYRQRRATGVHDAPECRAVAISDGATTFVLAAMDLVGASGPLLSAIREKAARLTGLPAANILVSCTHSHASPDMQGLWGGVGSSYETHVTDRAMSAIAEAHRSLVPAVVSAGTSSLSGVVRNRRGWPETDETLTVARCITAGGAPIATIVNYACHPTASGPLNTEVSRDWCGYTADIIDAAAGGVTVYVNGAIGDVNPAHDGGFEAAQSLGEAVARAALATLPGSDTVSGAIELRTQPLELPINYERLSTRVQDAVARAGPALRILSEHGGLAGASRALHAAGRADLAQLVAALAGMSERPIARRDGRSSVVTQASYLRIGDDVEAFAAPGEVLTRLGLPMRRALTAPHRLSLGLTHDTLGYFVPEDEWMTGHNNNYEESVSMGKHSGTVLSEALMSFIARTPGEVQP